MMSGAVSVRPAVVMSSHHFDVGSSSSAISACHDAPLPT
jgi:hypothetical protein